MVSGTAGVEAVREAIPGSAVEAFVPVTHLGDPLFFVVLAAVVYWVGDHERGSHLVGALLLGLGLTVALKEALALPRPPAELHLVAVEGHGLPSGHAAGAVVVYGALAALYDVGPRRPRYAAAALLAGLVAASRVVLGVHYVGDVLAGVAVGAVALAVVLRFREHSRSPPAFYAAAAVAALAGAVPSRLAYDAALLLFGGAVGALAYWYVAAPPPSPPRRVTAACGVVVLPTVVALVYAGMRALTSPLALVGATALAMALVLATPHGAAWLGARLPDGDRRRVPDPRSGSR